MRNGLIALRRAWIATTLFVATSALIWMKLVGWEGVLQGLPVTLLLMPVIWGLFFGARRAAGLIRGLVAGAVAGLVTELLPHTPTVLSLLLHDGPGDGDYQIAATVFMGITVMIAFWSLILGSVVGLLAAAIQRRVESHREADARRSSLPPEADRLAS